MLSVLLLGCAPQGAPEAPDPVGVSAQALSGSTRTRVAGYFAQRRWLDAIGTCQLALAFSPGDCEARYCELLGRTMVFVDQLNDYLLPRFQSTSSANLFDVVRLLVIDRQLADMAKAADAAAAGQCSYDLPLLPLRIGNAADPLVLGEVRGRHTPRGAYLLGAIANGMRYTLATLVSPPAVPAPPPGQTAPGLPALLERMRQQIAAHDALLFSTKVTPNPSLPQGGWWDKDGSGAPSLGDELLIDIFQVGQPGGAGRVFDFSGARFVRGGALPLGALTPTSALPPARCGYQRYHIDTIRSGAGVGTTDGMGFSPDGSRLVLPLVVNGKYQLHLLNADGTNPVCITCTTGSGQNDGARWRPGSADTLVFISNRDHPYPVGGAGGGAGQELYAMKIDGSKLSRLTVSGAWATNYHVNWSRDGKKIVWGRTQGRTWDVVVADFVEDAAGFRLANLKTLPRDTTWWEPHGFSADGAKVLASHSRAGLLSSDIYAVRVSDGQLTRLTGDLSWDEHAHLSPDGRKLAWMSGRSRPASMLRLNDGALSPIFDFFWIAPGVFFEFVNPPAGYAAELYIMDADGKNVQQLTSDGEVVADSQWSPDGRRIVFRQSEPRLFGGARVRVLTFDDCQ